MTKYNNSQLEELAQLIQEADCLLSNSKTLDLDSFQTKSRFDWQLDSIDHCERHNIVRKFIQLMENIDTPSTTKEFSEEEVIAQLRLRIQPLFALSKEMASQR